MTASPTPPDAQVGLPSEEERRTALYLGFDPYAPETWTAEVVNRLSRIRAEQGDAAFSREVAKLTSAPAGVASPFNACCYRDECRALLDRALSAEAKLAQAVEALGLVADQDLTEIALDPDWPRRICAAARSAQGR